MIQLSAAQLAAQMRSSGLNPNDPNHSAALESAYRTISEAAARRGDAQLAAGVTSHLIDAAAKTAAEKLGIRQSGTPILMKQQQESYVARYTQALPDNGQEQGA